MTAWYDCEHGSGLGLCPDCRSSVLDDGANALDDDSEIQKRAGSAVTGTQMVTGTDTRRSV